MYKVTQFDSTIPIYDSKSNPLPEGAVYFHTHQTLWKDDIFIGRIYLDDKTAILRIETHPPLTFARKDFQELFMRDVPIVELLYHANEIRRVDIYHKMKHSQKNHESNLHVIRLYSLGENGDEFFGELHYWLK